MTALHSPYPIVELRRTAVIAGGRPHYARYLETWCTDQDGHTESFAFGQFFERDHADRFISLRGYRDLDARAAMRAAAVARAREEVLQRYTVDSDALLLRPLHDGAALPALAPVHPGAEPDGAQGLAVAQLLPVAPGALQRCAAAADAWFARYNGRGMIEAGILSSLEDDGPAYLVWLGLLRDDTALDALRPQCEACAAALAQDGLLDGCPELIVLTPAPRSRLRWGPRTIA